MHHLSIDTPGNKTTVNAARFHGAGGVEECHLVVRPVIGGCIEEQLRWTQEAYAAALDSMGWTGDTAVFRRFFCSDLINQKDALANQPFANRCQPDVACAVSWAGQSPAPPAKVTLWAYHIRDPHGELRKTQEGGALTVERGELAHHWTTGYACADGGSPYDQTLRVFDAYEDFLASRGLSLADHVIRTWFFAQNIDANYEGLVVARRERFAERGLTPETHYIASTGIGGTYTEIAAKVVMDAYAISGVRSDQIEFLAAPEHLSPTHIYGVTFERGSSVAYRDRKHVLISGTASIDQNGRILHPGDVKRQLDRTLENIESLLARAGATLDDMGHFVTYVRDPSDCDLVTQQMRERFGDAPIAIVVAPVCRTGWLVEVEGMAVVAADNPGRPAF